MHSLAQLAGRIALIALIGAIPVGASAMQMHSAVSAFNSWCFKAGQTPNQARSNMRTTAGAPLPFTLTFWDDSLEPRPQGSPDGVERRCEVAFDGDHTAQAVDALRAQMQKPPVFGKQIALPATHQPLEGTVLIEGRELLRGRVAVVHVGMRGTQTFMAVDRLYADWEDS